MLAIWSLHCSVYLQFCCQSLPLDAQIFLRMVCGALPRRLYSSLVSKRRDFWAALCGRNKVSYTHRSSWNPLTRVKKPNGCSNFPIKCRRQVCSNSPCVEPIFVIVERSSRTDRLSHFLRTSGWVFMQNFLLGHQHKGKSQQSIRNRFTWWNTLLPTINGVLFFDNKAIPTLRPTRHFLALEAFLWRPSSYLRQSHY